MVSTYTLRPGNHRIQLRPVMDSDRDEVEKMFKGKESGKFVNLKPSRTRMHGPLTFKMVQATHFKRVYFKDAREWNSLDIKEVRWMECAFP